MEVQKQDLNSRLIKLRNRAKHILLYPRMYQEWNMFSPSVLGSDKIIIVEATLSNGDIINPFSGKTPILDSVEYTETQTHKNWIPFRISYTLVIFR